MPSLRDALESALAENFDDLAAHMAYADHLQEQGDPRGEFIQVQLALEDASRTAEERKALHKRERELLQAHESDWLGELAALLVEKNISAYRRKHDKINRRHWTRGWLDDLYLWDLDLPRARALSRAPAARFLRRLHIEHCGYGADEDVEPDDGIPEGSEYPDLYPLQRSLFLPHLRFFQLGEPVDFEQESYNSSGVFGEGVVRLIEKMTRLEELHLLTDQIDTAKLFALPNLTNLRVMLVYHDRAYPLEVLANNPALSRLTTLHLHPGHGFPDEEAYLRLDQVRALLHSRHLPALTHLHLHGSDLGDEGCAEIVRSGILKRLKVLDLAFGRIGDAGARVLAECPDIKRLELLSLRNNELTEAGRAVLNDFGSSIRSESQYEPGSNEYLWTGDVE